ncbi:hypothetical protein Tco_0671167 [Tanacetum coccineum]
MIALPKPKSNIHDEWWMETYGGSGTSVCPKGSYGRRSRFVTVWDNNIFTCKQAVGDERFIAVKGEWKGVNGDIFFVCIYGPHLACGKPKGVKTYHRNHEDGLKFSKLDRDQWRWALNEDGKFAVKDLARL